jgi:hypothetical protein
LEAQVLQFDFAWLLFQIKELSPAESAKEDGNAAFKKGDLPAALAAYTLALERDPSMVVAANNRALVNIRMQRFGDAEKDSNTVGPAFSPDFRLNACHSTKKHHKSTRHVVYC